MAERTASRGPINLSDVYQPHEGQQKVHDSTAKIKVLEIGRRWGKTRMALFELLRRFAQSLAIEAPPSLVPPFHAWIVCPNFPQSRQTWNEILALMPKGMIAENGIHQDEQFVYLQGSPQRPWGFLEIKSGAAPESLQTVGLDMLVISEAQDIPDVAFEKLLPTLRSPDRMGYAIIEGIPALHADHWFRRLFLAAERGRKDYEAFKFTAFENPFLTDDQKQAIYEDKEILRESSWRRMYLAEFSESAGYFSNINACVVGDLLPEPMPGARYVAGLDLGRKIDASVLHIFDAVERRLVARRAWDSGQSWLVIREGIAHSHSLWNFDRLVVDATGMGGDIFAEELSQQGLPVEPFIIHVHSRHYLLNSLAVAFERQAIQIPPIPEALRQLRAFQHRKTSAGNWRIEAPPGEHDDEVFAMALALTACEPPPSLTMAKSLGRMRYLPYQSETSGIPRGQGARMLAEARSKRMHERAEQAGVSL